MNSNRLNSIYNCLASLAILIGIGLVIFELQQARELARLQMIQETIATAQNEFMARYGDDIGSSMAKACVRTGELTDKDVYVLDALFSYQLHFIGRQKNKGELGPYNIDWKGEAQRRVGFVLGFPHGREWIKLYSSRDSEIMRFLKENTLLIDPIPCQAALEAFGRNT